MVLPTNFHSGCGRDCICGCVGVTVSVGVWARLYLWVCGRDCVCGCVGATVSVGVWARLYLWVGGRDYLWV